MDINIVKVCKNHGNLLLEDLIKSGKRSNGTQAFKCKKCMADYHKNHYAKNKEKVDAKHQEYKRLNPEKFRLIKNISAKKNRPKYREKTRERNRKNHLINPKIVRDRQKRWSKNAIEELKDWYVKQSFVKGTELKFKDVTPELIEAKRELMKLKRTIKKEKEIVKNT